MLLYLVRHGIAVDYDDPECPPDQERYLTERGIARTRKAAAGLRVLGVQPQLVLSSPYRRARETAEIVAEVLEHPVTGIRLTDALHSNANPDLLFTELCHAKAETVLCVGHAPHLDEVLARVLGTVSSATELKKAGAACLAMASFIPPRGLLEWLLTARILRMLGSGGKG